MNPEQQSKFTKKHKCFPRKTITNCFTFGLWLVFNNIIVEAIYCMCKTRDMRGHKAYRGPHVKAKIVEEELPMRGGAFENACVQGPQYRAAPLCETTSCCNLSPLAGLSPW